MHFPLPLAKLVFLSLIGLFALVANPTTGPGAASAEMVKEPFNGVELGLTPAARHALEESDDKAFPSADAGFSAYYQVGTKGSYGLNKDTVDDYIFDPLRSDDGTAMTGPATLVEIGDNYTVAQMHLTNIDGITSTVNLYYDDEGWVVAYLDNDADSSNIWYAKGVDAENPESNQVDLSKTTFLEAINLVVKDALVGMAIDDDATGFGFYHWQHTTADSFLMMAVVRKVQGPYPVQMAVPATLTVKEVSVTMWISQLNNAQAPCAKVTLDSSDLIGKVCTKGFHSESEDVDDFDDNTNHTWKLIQSDRDEGASGALMIILYAKPNA